MDMCCENREHVELELELELGIYAGAVARELGAGIRVGALCWIREYAAYRSLGSCVNKR